MSQHWKECSVYWPTAEKWILHKVSPYTSHVFTRPSLPPRARSPTHFLSEHGALRSSAPHQRMLSARFCCSLRQRPDITMWQCDPESASRHNNDAKRVQHQRCALSLLFYFIIFLRLRLFYILILISFNKSVEKYPNMKAKRSKGTNKWNISVKRATQAVRCHNVHTVHFFPVGLGTNGNLPCATSHINSLLTSFCEATKQYPLGMRNEGKCGDCLVENIWQLNYALSHMAW